MRKIDPEDFQRATRNTAREINRQIVLSLIREYQPLSRADLARRMGVARGTVGPIVEELLAEDVIYERASKQTRRGRKPMLLFVRERDRLVAAVDVRLSQTQIMLTDFAGREIALERIRTPATTPEGLTRELVARVSRMCDDHVEIGTCEGIGVVVPGMVQRETGRVLYAPTLGWRDVDLVGPLSDGLGIPVHIERDAVACALAHLWLSPLGDPPDGFVYVTVSDGVGAGLIVNGQVVRGSRDTAGEIGHVALSQDGPVCHCGQRGCLEAYASNPATVARYLGIDLSDETALAGLRERGLSVRLVIDRARARDAAAQEALTATGRYLGMGLSVLINTLNPGQIILAGAIMEAWDLVGPSVLRVVRERALTNEAGATPIVPETTDERTRLRGATALVVAPTFAAPVVG